MTASTYSRAPVNVTVSKKSQASSASAAALSDGGCVGVH
jgi:hypothetical protein